MHPRPQVLARLVDLLTRFPVVAIIGMRQVGKTTLARTLAQGWKGPITSFDLEHPTDLARLADPLLALESLTGLVVIDEIQRLPALFPVLRVLADRPGTPARFLILGSAAPSLIQQGSESLAGRICFHHLGGLALDEIDATEADRLWLRGGLPRSFLADGDAASLEWRQAYVQTFLERDLPQLGVRVAATTMRRFWSMLAHYHGQVWNSSEFARSFGVADTTVRTYLDHLAAALVVRMLPPWHENIGKRQVKSPKVYLADTGLLHTLLNLPTQVDLEGHPKLGASWEGFVLAQIERRLGARSEECFFWATHASAELDLLVIRGRQRRGFEIKRTSAPTVTPSMRHALTDLKLDRIEVIHAGAQTFPLAERIRAVALRDLGLLEPLE